VRYSLDRVHGKVPHKNLYKTHPKAQISPLRTTTTTTTTTTKNKKQKTKTKTTEFGINNQSE
jgi:hypothetical protein